jgi:hypothetical protein
MPGAALNTVLATPDARRQEMFIALVANDTTPVAVPAPVNLTVVTPAVAAGAAAQAVTLTSATLPIALQVGQRLVFKHSTGSFLFECTTLAALGATTEITGIAREGIPIGAVAQFPARFELALNIDTSETTGTSTFATFDHDGISEVARGEGEQSITTGAGNSYYNAGLDTLVYAQRNGLDIGFVIETPNPDSNAFAEPPYEWGVGVVNDVSKGGGVNDKSTRTVGISIKGGLKYVAPVAA